MPEYTPPAAATRKLSEDELFSLSTFLTGDVSLDDFVSEHNLVQAHVDQILQETGITLPSQSPTLDADHAQLYTDVLSSDLNVWDASQSFNFEAQGAVDALQKSGLRVPLNANDRGIYDAAFEGGATTSDVANYFGANEDHLNIILGGANLELPGIEKQLGSNPTTSLTAGDPTGGAPSTASFAAGFQEVYDNAFQFVPQAPKEKLTMNGDEGFKSDDTDWTGTTDTILTSGRGVTKKANVKKQKLTGSLV